jgi:hypothetical protein
MIDVFSDTYEIRQVSKTAKSMMVLISLISLQLYFTEFVEALVRCSYHQKKHQLEEEPDEDGGGMSPATVVKQLDIILNALDAAASTNMKKTSSIKQKK